MFNGGDSFLHRSWRLSVWSSSFLWRKTLSQYMAWLPELWQNIAPNCSVQQRGIYDHGWPTHNLNLQSSYVLHLVMSLFLRHFHFLKSPFLIIRIWVTGRAQTANGIFQTSNNSTYISLPKTSARRIIPVKLFYRVFLSRADASR